MRMDDMILIGVDDHIVEPPDIVRNHLPKQYLDEAPRLESICFPSTSLPAQED